MSPIAESIKNVLFKLDTAVMYEAPTSNFASSSACIQGNLASRSLKIASAVDFCF